MRTAEERIVEYCNQVGIPVDAFKASLTRLIKEQDRDTRHVCAEAVDAVISTDMPSDACWKEDACDACMNVKVC